jgi:protoporphyrin/coproporphyrin ferrochelatase
VSAPATAPIGVLLMAYGGPESLDNLPGFLADIRHGRPTTRAVLEEIRHNYAQIGGRSPLLEFTRRQAAAVEAALNRDGDRFKIYLGMRHWRPWIEETVRDMLNDGITRAVALVLAPHYSGMSIARYFAKVRTGLELARGELEIAFINGHHDAPEYIQALVNRVEEGLSRWPAQERERVHVILSAHSLPERILRAGDPYQDQLFATARLVAAGAGLPDERWSWSYQSAGRSPEPWLGPQIQEHIPALAARGVRDIISIPIGFVSDHVEILYDIDILARGVAREHGVRLERPPALNDDPLYIAALTRLIREAAAPWLPAGSRA